MPLEITSELMQAYHNRGGFTVTTVNDTNSYHTRLNVSDGNMAALRIMSRPFKDDWNYAIQSQE